MLPILTLAASWPVGPSSGTHDSWLSPDNCLTWYRADSPPDVNGPRVVVVPTLSLDQLPREYEAKCQQDADCRWVAGRDP